LYKVDGGNAPLTPASPKEASLRSLLVCRAIEAINQGNLDVFLPLFGPSATVVDVSTYGGYEAIRAWAQRETFIFQVVGKKNEEGTFCLKRITK
jgi:hypothetical protein